MTQQHRLIAGTFKIDWSRDGVDHTHHFNAGRLNPWVDVLPESLRAGLPDSGPGEWFEIPEGMTGVVNPYDFDNVHRVGFGRIRRQADGTPVSPRFGRFYPKGLLAGFAGISRDDLSPFRCLHMDEMGIRADLNHPMAGKEIRLGFRVRDRIEDAEDQDGSGTHWLERALDGPGMESRWESIPTDFFSDRPFERQDEQPDVFFYDRPRFVQHLDARAIEVIKDLYGRLLAPGMRVLDLMSSWTSHLPGGLELARFSGLGMNRQELEANDQLTDYEVLDLNGAPRLPYPDDGFDAVICTASVEYLVHPFEVFAEVRRILQPGGVFILTFSNRWFPPKAVRIWTQLHEFERMGLVLEYFLRTGGFDGLNVYSIRGLPRPEADRYYPGIPMSDPVFAVWGTKTGS